MRFRFCGDLDCPDWVLAEISMLAKLTSVKMKLLCVQVINEILAQAIDYEKVTKLTADAKYDTADIKSAIIALNFIYTRAAKFGVDGETLSNELQQLGLPREHSVALCKVYEDRLQELQNILRERSMRLSRLENVDWRVDFVLSSSLIEDVFEPEVHLKITKSSKVENNGSNTASFTVSNDKFKVLLMELKRASKLMETSLP